jgi:hypothetical protein
MPLTLNSDGRISSSLFNVDSDGDVTLSGSIDGVAIGSNTAVTSLTVNGNVSIDGGTVKLDGNYPVGTKT